MLAAYQRPPRAALIIVFGLLGCVGAHAQSSRNSTSVGGTVLDPRGAVVPNTIVENRNPVRQFDRSAVTGSTGVSRFPKFP